jgi:hypothetical protein
MRLKLGGIVASVFVLVLAACGGGGGATKSFTVEFRAEGKTAYMVVSAPSAHAAGFKDVFTKAGKAKDSSIVSVTDGQSPQGPLNCSLSLKIGQPHAPGPGFQPFVGDPVTVKVYGKNLEGNVLCGSVQHQGL